MNYKGLYRNLFTFRYNKKEEKHAFTLIEILVVITLILILSGIIIASIGNPTSDARDARRLTDLGQIQASLELYYEQNDLYPIQSVLQEEELTSSSDTGNKLVEGDFIPSLPVDPLDDGTYEYYYCGTADGSAYALKAFLETDNDALASDYDKDWPDTDICDCNDIVGDGNTDDTESAAPYIYCIRGL